MSHKNSAVRLIALFEGVKGMAAIIASLGLLGLVHHDIRHVAYALIGHFHLNPEANLPNTFLVAVDWLLNGHVTTVFLLAWAYAAIRLVEAYGLWRDLSWAEWLAALSGIIYLPIEAEHLASHATLINLAVLLGNIVVIVYMAYRLWQRRVST